MDPLIGLLIAGAMLSAADVGPARDPLALPPGVPGLPAEPWALRPTPKPVVPEGPAPPWSTPAAGGQGVDGGQVSGGEGRDRRPGPASR